MTDQNPRQSSFVPHATLRTGVSYGLGAYLFWGMVPVYFKSVAMVPVLEVLAHRILWALALLSILMFLRGRWPDARAVFKSRKTTATLLLTMLLVSTNWGLFMYAVVSDQVLQSSLAYFINPLLNVILGFVFLKERLRLAQTVGVLIAASGVLLFAVYRGEAPWLALAMTATFATYGILRKTAPVRAMVGLTLETAMLAPFALAFLIYLGVRGDGFFLAGSWKMNGLLMFAGVATALPLLWFTEAARRLRFATVGLLQYITPTGHFLLAVLLYHEVFSIVDLIAFGLIWMALLIYSIDSWRAMKKSNAVSDSTATD